MAFILKERHKHLGIYNGCITKRAYKENLDVELLAPTQFLWLKVRIYGIQFSKNCKVKV